MIYDKDKASVSFMGHTITGYDVLSGDTLPKKPWYAIVNYRDDNPDETRVELTLDDSNYTISPVFKNGSEVLKMILDQDPYNDKVTVTLKDNVLNINGGLDNECN